MPEPLYHRRRDELVPTLRTTGPWRSDAQHGGPVGALIAHELRREVEADEWLGQVGLDLIRPVPIEPLTFKIDRTTSSRRVGRLDGQLTIAASGEIAVRVTATTLRGREMPDPSWRPDEHACLPGPESEVTAPDVAPAAPTPEPGPAYHRDGVRFRFASGQFGQPGPADAWIRLEQAVVDDEPVAPLDRVMAAADFGSGISSIYPFGAPVGLINSNVLVVVHRPLVGEWVRATATTRLGPDGVGHCVTTLGDELGPCGMASQLVIGIDTT